MITFKPDLNIFDSESVCIVNPVNLEGVMGKGLALEFKKRFPNNFINYKKACKSKELIFGELYFFNENEKLICNFPTKTVWREQSNLILIDIGLEKLKNKIISFNIQSVTIPKLGCGLGGLEWTTVRELILNRLKNVYCDIIIIGD
jgi:O-acetyl-ADP-ribose deacetylase (regulator of RNase III)